MQHFSWQSASSPPCYSFPIISDFHPISSSSFISISCRPLPWLSFQHRWSFKNYRSKKNSPEKKEFNLSNNEIMIYVCNHVVQNMAVVRSVATSGFPSKIERSKDSRIAMELLSLLPTFLLHFQRSFFPKASTLVGSLYLAVNGMRASEKRWRTGGRREGGRGGEETSSSFSSSLLHIARSFFIPRSTV